MFNPYSSEWVNGAFGAVANAIELFFAPLGDAILAAEGGANRQYSDEEIGQMRREFLYLRRQLNAVSGRSSREAADRFGALATPFTARWDVEVGASVFHGRRTFGVDLATMGNTEGERRGVRPSRHQPEALLHTHPTWSTADFSGYWYSPGGGRVYDSRSTGGDLSTYVEWETDGYVYHPTKGASYFDFSAFNEGKDEALRWGRPYNAAWFVEKIQ